MKKSICFTICLCIICLLIPSVSMAAHFEVDQKVEMMLGNAEQDESIVLDSVESQILEEVLSEEADVDVLDSDVAIESTEQKDKKIAPPVRQEINDELLADVQAFDKVVTPIGLNERIAINPNGETLEYTPTESGDYRLQLEVVGGHYGCQVASVDSGILIMTYTETIEEKRTYAAFNFKVGYSYSILLSGVEAVTLRKETLRPIVVDENVDINDGYISELFKFVSPEDGSYIFACAPSDNTGEMFLYYGKNDFPDPVVRDTIYLKKDEACYVLPYSCNSVSVGKVGKSSDNANLDSMLLVDSLNPNESKSEMFSIVGPSAYFVASNKNKPYLKVTLAKDSKNAKVVLRNSQGKQIKWERMLDEADGTTTYATPVLIDGNSRTYYIMVTPESGKADKEKFYHLAVNPPTKYPNGFSAKWSSKENAAVLNWEECKGAAGYRIYRIDGSGYGGRLVKTIRSNKILSYIDYYEYFGKDEKYTYYMIPYSLNMEGKAFTSFRSESSVINTPK